VRSYKVRLKTHPFGIKFRKITSSRWICHRGLAFLLAPLDLRKAPLASRRTTRMHQILHRAPLCLVLLYMSGSMAAVLHWGQGYKAVVLLRQGENVGVTEGGRKRHNRRRYRRRYYRWGQEMATLGAVIGAVVLWWTE
jgi:hypothetical protein